MEDNITTSAEGERKKSAQVDHSRIRTDAQTRTRSKRPAADNEPEEIYVNVSFSNLCRKRQRNQTFKKRYLVHPYLKINLVHPSLKSSDFWFTLYFMANFTSISFHDFVNVWTHGTQPLAKHNFRDLILRKQFILFW